MNEQVSDQTVRLAVRTGKVTLRLLLRALAAWHRNHQRKKDVNRMAKDTPHGKQSVKELVGQGQGVSSMEIGDSGIRDFKKIANKYGVDFAIVKERDADAITQVLKEYAAKQTKRKKAAEKERPSILQKLKKFKEKVASMPRKDKEKRKEMER